MKKKTPGELRIRNSTAEFLTFAYQTGGDGVEIRVQDGTIWLSQRNMGALFETTPDNIGLHLKNIFAAGELIVDSVTEEFSVLQTEGARQVERVGGRESKASLSAGRLKRGIRSLAFLS